MTIPLRFSSVRKGTFAGLTANIRSGLVITSNIDFPDASFVDIGNASVDVVGSTLTITGDLLISDALIVLGFPFETLGIDVGDVTLTTNLALCVPDCDGSGQLNIDDFICFQTLFALGC